MHQVQAHAVNIDDDDDLPVSIWLLSSRGSRPACPSREWPLTLPDRIPSPSQTCQTSACTDITDVLNTVFALHVTGM